MIVDELIAVLGFDLKGEGDLRKFNQGLDGAERKARGFSTALLAIGGAVAGAFAGLAIGRQVGNFVSSIATVNAQFETYEATLKTITGSAEEASRSMDWITEFGRTTPYEAGQVTEAFVRLKAYGIDPMDGSLRTVGDAASAMGKSLMSGVEAIADAVTGENERLKEFGIRTKVEGQNITYSWTENGKVLTKTVKKDAVEIQKALMGIFGRFSGAMDEQSKTWVGMTSNLSDSWTEFLREIGEAGYYDDIKRRMQGTLDFVNRAFESGLVGDVAKGISDALIGTLDTVSHLATQAYRVGAAFFHAADGVLDLTSRVTGLSKGMAAAGLGAGLIASSAMGRGLLMAVARRVPFVAAALALDDIISGLNGDDSLVGSTSDGQQALDNLKAKFGELQTAATGFADSLGSVRERIAEALTLPDMPDIGLKMEGILERPAAMIDRTLKSFQQLVNDPAQLAIDLMTTAINNLSSAMDNVATVLRTLSTPIESIMSAIDSLIATLAKIDAMLPGANAVVQANPNADVVETTNEPAPRTPTKPLTFAPDAEDLKYRLQIEEAERVGDNPTPRAPATIHLSEDQMREAVEKIGIAADWLAQKLGVTADAISDRPMADRRAETEAPPAVTRRQPSPRSPVIDLSRPALQPEPADSEPAPGKSARVRPTPPVESQASGPGLPAMVQSAIEQVSAKFDGVRAMVQNYLADSRVQGAFAATDGGTSAVNAGQMAQGLENLRAQMQAMGAKEVSQSIQSTITNQDQRQFPVTNNVSSTVNMNVQQATQAPAAAARATSAAVTQAATPAPARIQGSASAP